MTSERNGRNDVLPIRQAVLLRPDNLPALQVRSEGEENLPEGGGYIIASNHLKWYDPVLLSVRLPVQISFAAKIQLFRIPALRWLLILTKQIPLEREKGGHPRVYRELVKQARERMERGLVFGLFPEGTRSRTGKLLEFKRGAVAIAAETQRPIVPVGIAYYRRGPRLTARIMIGTPMSSCHRNTRELTKALERQIAAYSGQKPASDGTEQSL